MIYDDNLQSSSQLVLMVMANQITPALKVVNPAGVVLSSLNQDGTASFVSGAFTIRPDGSLNIPTLADSAATDSSLYFSSTTSQLCYKDSIGTTHTGGTSDPTVVHKTGAEIVSGSKTFTATQTFTVGSGQVGLSVITVDHSAIDITKTSNTGEFMMRFNTCPAPGGWNPQTYINNSGAYFSNAWIVVSGHPTSSGDNYRIMGVKGTPGAPLGPDPSMIAVWSDVNGPAIQVQGSNGKSAGSFLLGLFSQPSG
jgi:hypothetical protein